MNRMHLKKRKVKKNNIINKIIIILILLIIASIYILKIFNEKAIPHIDSYSKIEANKIVSNVISSTVSENISKYKNINDLIITNKDSIGNIKNIDFNMSLVNDVLVSSTKLIEQNLEYLESGNVDKLKLNSSLLSNKKKLNKGIIYEVPSGVIFDNVLLNNIFPKIPVRLSLVGNIFCRINTDVKEYGINNALIKVNINVTVEVKILLPFISNNATIEVDIPILMKVIEGNVPSYYFDGYLSSPSITKSIND